MMRNSPENLAPGPDGRRFHDRSFSQWWRLFRELYEAAQRGEPRPPNYRRASVPKSDGIGRREIWIGNCEDRVQQRALLEMTSRLVDPQLADFSLGFRPSRGPHLALAAAKHAVEKEGRVFARVEDVESAFDNVCIPLLREILVRIFQNPAFVDRLLLMSQRNGRRGLVQGSPLSPLLLNIYLHEMLDRRYSRRGLSALYLRFADDLLVLAETRDSVGAGRDEVEALLKPAGMQIRVKSGRPETTDLRKRPVRWLGFMLHVVDGRLRLNVPKSAFDRLEELIREACEQGYDSYFAARCALYQWIAAYGPAWTPDEQDRALPRIRRTLVAHECDEVYQETTIRKRCSSAQNSWESASYPPVHSGKRVSRIRLGTRWH